MPRRGCGYRIRGGVYWESHIPRLVTAGEMSMGLEDLPDPVDVQQFVLDPPIPIDLQRMGMIALGVKAIVRDGVTHIIDWIGEAHYATKGAFLEEVGRLGVSRRLPVTFPFGQLTNESRLLCVHRKGIPYSQGTQWKPAIFASFPLTQVVIVRDPVGHTDETARRRVERSGIQVPYETVEA